VFRRRSAGATDGTAQDSPGAQSPDGPADTKPRSPAEAAKGRPTPKRSVAEAKRRQPITGSSRAAAAGPRTKEEKAKARTNRAGRYEAMRRGEEWALNPRDRGPGRALARDFVDSKRRVSEYYMYILVVLLAAVFVRSAAAIISPVVLLLILVIVVDATLIRRSLGRLMAERLPRESTRGLTMYAVMRALQIRRFRVPTPRVHPGDKI
jgi:DUF3043 family protein